jgi:hypothetical protein
MRSRPPTRLSHLALIEVAARIILAERLEEYTGWRRSSSRFARGAVSTNAAVLLGRRSNPDVQAAVRKLAAWSECPRRGYSKRRAPWSPTDASKEET